MSPFLQEAFQRQAWLLSSTSSPRLRAPVGPRPLSPLAQEKTDRGWLPAEPHATHSHELLWGMRQEEQVLLATPSCWLPPSPQKAPNHDRLTMC